MSITYKSAGVDLNAADESLAQIGSLVQSTFNRNVLRGIGLFAGFYSLDTHRYSQPILVSSIDGVGTKLKVAFMMDRHDTVGQDLVNHCVNDIMTSGADPLFFLDYIGTQNLKPKVAEQIVSGMARACKENGCALVGGETAEMPGFYTSGEYDLVGSIVGVVDKENIIDGQNISVGDVLIGLPSNGFHTNGYSLIRSVLFDHAGLSVDSYEQELGATWGEVLLRVHRSYHSVIKAIRNKKGIRGISHITGGGIEGNTKRLLRAGLKLQIDWDNWQMPVEFRLVQKYGNIADEEMRNVFNLGIGLVFIVSEDRSADFINLLKDMGEKPVRIGKVSG